MDQKPRAGCVVILLFFYPGNTLVGGFRGFWGFPPSSPHRVICLHSLQHQGCLLCSSSLADALPQCLREGSAGTGTWYFSSLSARGPSVGYRAIGDAFARVVVSCGVFLVTLSNSSGLWA